MSKQVDQYQVGIAWLSTNKESVFFWETNIRHLTSDFQLPEAGYPKDRPAWKYIQFDTQHLNETKKNNGSGMFLMEDDLELFWPMEDGSLDLIP